MDKVGLLTRIGSIENSHRQPRIATRVLALSTMASNKDAPPAIKRNDLYEALRLSQLPDEQSGSQDPVKRFISRTPAWRPGNELPWGSIDPEGYKKGNTVDFNPAAFGGHVFAQAPLAAARAVEEEENGSGSGNDKLGIHVSLKPS